MSKWTLSDAAYWRVVKRIKETLGCGDFFFRAQEIVKEAVAGENFGNESKTEIAIIKKMMKEGELLYFCANYLDEVAHERDELREAGRDIVSGIETLKRSLK